jgi:hypothetical protein
MAYLRAKLDGMPLVLRPIATGMRALARAMAGRAYELLSVRRPDGERRAAGTGTASQRAAARPPPSRVTVAASCDTFTMTRKKHGKT